MTKGSRRWPGLPIRISAGTSPIHGGPPTGHRASAVNTKRHLGAGIHRLDLPWHIHITSHGCLIGLGSGEFGSQVDDLCSLSHSSGHSWAVFTVWQVALSYWGETAIWVLLPWAIVLGLQQFLRWWCVFCLMLHCLPQVSLSLHTFFFFALELNCRFKGWVVECEALSIGSFSNNILSFIFNACHAYCMGWCELLLSLPWKWETLNIF